MYFLFADEHTALLTLTEVCVDVGVLNNTKDIRFVEKKASMKTCISQPSWQEISRFCLPRALSFSFFVVHMISFFHAYPHGGNPEVISM